MDAVAVDVPVLTAVGLTHQMLVEFTDTRVKISHLDCKRCDRCRTAANAFRNIYKHYDRDTAVAWVEAGVDSYRTVVMFLKRHQHTHIQGGPDPKTWIEPSVIDLARMLAPWLPVAMRHDAYLNLTSYVVGKLTELDADPGEVDRWLAAGIGFHGIVAHYTRGLADTLAWVNAGVDVNAISTWVDVGATPPEAQQYLEAFGPENHPVAELYTLSAGDLEVARRWFDAAGALNQYRPSCAARTVGPWRDAGFTPEQVSEWAAVNPSKDVFDVAVATHNNIDLGRRILARVPVTQVKTWLEALPCGVADAARWAELRVSDPDAAFYTADLDVDEVERVRLVPGECEVQVPACGPGHRVRVSWTAKRTRWAAPDHDHDLESIGEAFGGAPCPCVSTVRRARSLWDRGAVTPATALRAAVADNDRLAFQMPDAE